MFYFDVNYFSHDIYRDVIFIDFSVKKQQKYSVDHFFFFHKTWILWGYNEWVMSHNFHKSLFILSLLYFVNDILKDAQLYF